MPRTAFIFTGRVQGVGFRATARDIAQGHPVTGWVRNEADGSVRMEAQGAGAAIEALVAELRERMGRNISAVSRMDAQVVDGESGFAIRR